MQIENFSQTAVVFQKMASTLISSHPTSYCSPNSKNDIFQDLPLIDRNTRLSVIELRHSDKQIVNELVYRWCRILTREPKHTPDGLPPGLSEHAACEDSRRVLIIDMITAINLIRLKTVLKKDEKRMRMIGMARSCKINSTFVTLNAHLKCQSILSSSLKLIVIYQDEFFILKTLKLLGECLKNTKSQILLVVPKLDRQEHDVLNLTSNYQQLRCDFCVKRSDIGPAPPTGNNDSYQTCLNEVYFQRTHSSKALPERVKAELRDSGLAFQQNQQPIKLKQGEKRFALDVQ